MATGARPALGLSIGVTNLAAVAADHSITRKPVLTLYRQRPPEVGVPSENPRLDEPGLVITDFVDRVGDSVGIVAADGSVYRSEALVADALLALAYTATGGRALPGSVTVTYPAHWGPAAVAALDSALRRASEWSHGTSSTAQPLSLLPDAAAALYAIRADPGIPARGIVAVCDFGGSGTGITLVDAADEYRPVAATVRHQAFSGDLIDQSLLSYVMSELPGTGAFDPAGTSAIGSLTKLRIECRKAKERLSSSTVTTLTDALGGDIRLTRNELEDTIRDSLDSVGRALEQTLARSGIRTAELVAIVSVGGGANIPAVTTTLSGRFCVPVVRTPRPQLTAAFGGALWAARRPGDTSATVLTAVTSATATAPADAPASVLQPALAWSEADEDSHIGPAPGYTAARPSLSFDHDAHAEPEPKSPPIPWYRLPAVIITGTTVAVLLVGAAVAIGLSTGDQPTAGSGSSARFRVADTGELLGDLPKSLAIGVVAGGCGNLGLSHTTAGDLVAAAGAIERATVGLRGGGCIQRGQDPLFDLLPEERCETPGRLVQAFHQRRLVAAMGRSRDLQVGLGQARMRGIGDDAPAGRAAAAVQLAGEHQDRQLRLAIGRHRGVRPLEL